MPNTQHVQLHVARLERAREECELVSIERSHVGADPLVGHVVDVSEQWVTLSVSDAGTADGWVAVRTPQVTLVGSEEGACFIRRGLENQGNWPPQAPVPPLALVGGTNALILSAAAGFPLITLMFEGEDPSTCLIGRPGRLRRGFLQWEELSPSGEWSNVGRQCELSRVTRVEVGSLYQRALAHASYLRSLLDPEWHHPALAEVTRPMSPDHTDTDPNILLG